MDAQQELYTTILVSLRSKLGNVYDGALPPEGTPYPFVYLGDVTDSDVRTTKGSLWGRSDIRIHVWHNKTTERGTLSGIMAQVKDVLRAVTVTGSYTWDIRSLTTNILPDNTTKTPLLHGVIDATYIHY